MAQKIQLDLLLNAQGASTTLKELRDNVKLANEELEQTPKYTDRYYQLRAAIATANTELQGQEKLLKGLTSEEIAGAYARIGGGISSTFTAASSALRIFGIENENVLAAAAKAQDLLTFAISTRQIQEGLLSTKMLSNIVADKARLAATKNNIVQTNIETGVEAVNTKAIDANTNAQVKNTGAKAQNIVATEGETVATAAATTSTGLFSAAINFANNTMKAFYSTIVANPFAAVITLIGLLVAGVIGLKDSLSQAAEEQERLNAAIAEGQAEVSVSRTLLRGLQAVVQDTTKSEKERLAAYRLLQKQLPGLEKLTLDQAISTGKLNEEIVRNNKLQQTKVANDELAAVAVEKTTATTNAYRAALNQLTGVQGLTLDQAKERLQLITNQRLESQSLTREEGTYLRALEESNQAQAALNANTKEYIPLLTEENIILEENKKQKGGNKTATQAQINANNKLKLILDELMALLKDEVRLYKELGQVVKVEDRIPSIVERANQAYKERLKVIEDTNNQALQGLQDMLLLDPKYNVAGFKRESNRFKGIFKRNLIDLRKDVLNLLNITPSFATAKDIEKATEETRRAYMENFRGLVGLEKGTADQLQKLQDNYAKRVEENFTGLLTNIGQTETQFIDSSGKVTDAFLKAFAAGEIDPITLKSVNALTSNIGNLNKLVSEGIVPINDLFDPQTVDTYLAASRQLLAVEGEIGFEYDQQSKKVKQIVIDRENYAKNVQIVADFENDIRKKTTEGLKNFLRIEEKGYEDRVKLAYSTGEITKNQYEALISTLDAGSKRESEFAKVIAQIAEQRLESIKNQVTGTLAEIDRIRKYNFEFEKSRADAAANASKAIVGLVKKESEDFLELYNKRLGGVLRGVITNNDKIAEANKFLEETNLDFTKYTEEQKLEIYDALYSKQDELADKARQNITKQIEQFIQIAQQAFNAYQEYITRAEELATQRIIAEEQDKFRQLEKAYSEGLVLEKTYQKKKTELTEEYAAQRAAIEKKYRIEQLKLDRLQAIANGALGVTRAIGEGGILGLITGAIVAAAAASEVVIISKQLSDAQALKRGGWIKAQQGMILSGPSHEYGGIKLQNGGYELEGGEAVINRVSSRNYQGLLSQVNQMGGGRPLVASFDDSRIIDAIAKQRMEPIRAYVIEQDITRAQAINKRLDQLSRF